jgi:hypothetical protein
VISLRQATYLYRKIRPQKMSHDVSKEEILYSSEIDVEFLRSAIKGNRHFEQLVTDSSKNYLEVRRKIGNRFHSK